MFVVLTLKTLEEILPFNKLNEAYTQGDWLTDLPNKILPAILLRRSYFGYVRFHRLRNRI